VWDRERTAPDILLEYNLPLLGTEMICGFSGFSSFFFVCEKISTISFEPRRMPGPDLGDRNRQLKFCRTPSHLPHSRGEGSVYRVTSLKQGCIRINHDQVSLQGVKCDRVSLPDPLRMQSLEM